MSDDEDPFLADIEAYEEDQPYNYEPYSEIDIKKSPNTPENKLNQNQQDSVPKNQTLVIDLMSKMRKPDNPPSDSINQSSEIELPIFPALGNQSSILAEEGKEASKTTAPKQRKCVYHFQQHYLKKFTGYARMITALAEDNEELDNALKECRISKVEFNNSYSFKIEWISKNHLAYACVSEIKNKYNDNKVINHSRAFQEVDSDAGKLLIEMIQHPPQEIPMSSKQSQQFPKKENLFGTQKAYHPSFQINATVHQFGYFPMYQMRPQIFDQGYSNNMYPIHSGYYDVPCDARLIYDQEYKKNCKLARGSSEISSCSRSSESEIERSPKRYFKKRQPRSRSRSRSKSSRESRSKRRRNDRKEDKQKNRGFDKIERKDDNRDSSSSPRKNNGYRERRYKSHSNDKKKRKEEKGLVGSIKVSNGKKKEVPQNIEIIDLEPEDTLVEKFQNCSFFCEEDEIALPNFEEAARPIGAIEENYMTEILENKSDDVNEITKNQYDAIKKAYEEKDYRSRSKSNSRSWSSTKDRKYRDHRSADKKRKDNAKRKKKGSTLIITKSNSEEIVIFGKSTFERITPLHIVKPKANQRERSKKRTTDIAQKEKLSKLIQDNLISNSNDEKIDLRTGIKESNQTQNKGSITLRIHKKGDRQKNNNESN